MKTKLVEINDIKIRQHGEKKEIISDQINKYEMDLKILIKDRDDSLLELKDIHISNTERENLVKYHKDLIENKKKSIKLLQDDYDLYERKICYRTKIKEKKNKN